MVPGQLIYHERWCSVCRKRRDVQDVQMAKLRKLVARRGGEVLSSTYVNAHTKLEFRCRSGHTWLAMPASINSGSWCVQCSRDERAAAVGAKLESLVKRRGGEVLSRYANWLTPIRLRCAEGHEWEPIPRAIFHDGTWCPRCTSNRRKSTR
jgi:hypothetical protein